MIIVKIDNVCKSYNKRMVINSVSLDIKKGERIVFFGPSGCGKTTLLRLIAGFINPDKGTIIIDGRVASENGRCIIRPENREVGMVFQDLALWPHMSVYKNLEFGLKAKGIPKAERDKCIIEMLEKVKMSQSVNTVPNELSGGQQQRIALARALVMRPAILLMDEPLSSLDTDLSILLRKEILRLQEEFAITIIYVTHDRDEAFFLATRIVMIAGGKVQRIGTAREISEYLSKLSDTVH